MFRGWIVVACGFCMTLSFGITYSYSDFFIPLQQEFGWTTLSDSTIPGISLVVFSVGSLLGGKLSSSISLRTMSVFGACLTGLGIVLSSQIQSYFELLILFGVVTSFGTSLIVIAGTALSVKWFLMRRGLAVGIAASGSGVGTLIVPPIAESIILNLGWRTSLFILGISFLTLLLAASFFMKSPEEVAQRPYGWETMSGEDKKRLKDYTLLEALHTARYWIIYSMFFLGTVGATMFIVLAAPFGRTQGISAFSAALCVGAFGAGSLSARIILGAVSDRIPRETTLIFAILSELAGLVALPFVSTAVDLFLICGFAIGFGYGGYLADFISLIGDLFGSGSVASIWGMTETSYGIGGLVGPIVGGIYYSFFGSYTGAFGIAALGIAGALILSLYFSRHIMLRTRFATI